VTEKKQDLEYLFRNDPSAGVARVVMQHMCLPYGFGEKTTWSQAHWFDAGQGSSSPYDGALEDAWPWVARNVLYAVKTLERNDRLRVDVWTAAKTGELAGTPDFILPVTSFTCPPKALSNLSILGSLIDLNDAAERIEAHVRLFGRVPAERILAVWRWGNNLAEMGEVAGHEVSWTIDDGIIVHHMDGAPVTRRSANRLTAPWAAIQSLHEAAR
jgi:hypothetical protein